MEGRGVVADQCETCESIWFDENEIVKALKKDTNKTSLLRSLREGITNPQKTNLACPRCSIPLLEGSISGHSEKLQTCPKCNGVWVQHKTLAPIFAHWGEEPPQFGAPEKPMQIFKPESELQEVRLGGRFSFSNPITNALAVPVTLFLSYLFIAIPFTHFLGDLFLTVRLHELGHAVIIWQGSQIALPFALVLPFVAFTPYLGSQSYFLSLITIGILFYIVRSCWKERTYFGIFLSGIYFLFFIYFTFLCPQDQWRVRASWGGIAGEIYLGMILIIGFYYRLPDKLRWDFFRFPFLVLGAYSFASSSWRWFNISHGLEKIPYGSLVEGEHVGDMNSLI